MRAGKPRYSYRVIAMLLALLLMVSDVEMITYARTETAENTSALDTINRDDLNEGESSDGGEEAGEVGDDGEGTGETGADGEGTGETGDDGEGTGETGADGEGTGETGADGEGTGEVGDDGEEAGETGADGEENRENGDGEAGDEDSLEMEPGTEEDEETGNTEDPLAVTDCDEELLKSEMQENLGVPQNVSVEIDWHTHKLSWDAVAGADGYEIQFAIDENLSPEELTDDDFRVFRIVTPEDVKSNISDDGTRMLYHISTKNELPIDPDDPFFINGNNYYPVTAQYVVYRVRAVVKDENDAYQPVGDFSDYVSVNGLYYAQLDRINEERRKRFNLPGTGPYVRFYLGDDNGTEYNAQNPINLHVGESIDHLTLWAVCSDGTRVSYPDMRDAVKKAEEEQWGSASWYKEENDNGYSFVWAIDETLKTDNIMISEKEAHIELFWRDFGNTVPDYRGLKAVAATDETLFMQVSLNGGFFSNNCNMFFYVPIEIQEAEEGVTYPDPDDKSVIFDDGEEMWKAFREKLHNREEEFVLYMTEEAYKKFCDDYGYYTILEDGEKSYESLAEVMDIWLYTQYEEHDWMEPWAGDNLLDSMSGANCSWREEWLRSDRYYGFSWSAKYLTTVEQEKKLDEKIAELLGEGGALHDAYISDNQLKKIQAAYNYTRGIKWVDGTKNPLNYTVYSGIVLGKGSCESSSLTFVRLCRELGVQARVVKDDYWGKAGNHAWNIVEYNGLWYYVDCTSGKFMKGSSGYNVSKQDKLYRSEQFKSSHPISKSDYALKKITYTLNGGTNAAGNPGVFETGDILTLAAPSMTGATFEGWYADSGFKTQIVGPEGGDYDTSSLPGNLTLYAKWRLNVYTLSYDMNIPDNAKVRTEAVISDVAVRYTVSVKIAANKCTLYKYAFTGWNTAPDGTGKSYKAGVTVKNLTAEDGAEYKLYAQWAPTTYTVKYDGNGSSVGLSVKGKTANTTMTFYKETNATAANGFTISGYQFKGWNTRADGRGLTLGDEETDGKVSGAAVIGTALETAYARDTKATVTLYAQWEAIPYTVKLYGNDGTDSGEPVVTFTMNTGEALSAKSDAKLTRNGYKLTSFNTQANGRGKKIALTAKNIAKPGETIELYAQWGSPLSYKVTYDLQGGKNPAKNPKNPTKFTVVSTEEQRTLVKPTRTGYTFVKWVDAACEDPESASAITVIPVDECRNIKLRAVWEENSYQVTYHGANEKYTDKEDTVIETYKYTELADAFAPAKAYTLKEGMEDKVNISAWTTQPNGKGKSYAVGKGFSRLCADNVDEMTGQGTVDLYAKWSTAVYRITYENCSSADGVKNSNAVSYAYNSGKSVSVKKPSRAGYLFTGWTVPEGKEYFDAAKNCIRAGTSEDVVLTANWIPITYEVKLNLNTRDKGVFFQTESRTVYGSRDGNGIAYNTEEAAFAVRDIVNIPEYYELVGWNTKSNGKGIAAECEKDILTGEITSVKLSGLCTKDKGTVTLYAIWKPKTYSITYQNVDPDSPVGGITELTGVKASNPTAYTYNASKTVKLKNPSKYGFVFEGWYTGYDASTGVYTEKVTSIPKGSHGDITLYGKWRVK